MSDPDLFAWIGEDELGSGEIGLKQAIVPAGHIPIVATKRGKVDRETIIAQLQAQADRYGKTIRLVRYAPGDTIITLTPSPKAEVEDFIARGRAAQQAVDEILVRVATEAEQRAAIVAAARQKVHEGAGHDCSEWIVGGRCELCDRVLE
jgi:hypothetical protein